MKHASLYFILFSLLLCGQAFAQFGRHEDEPRRRIAELRRLKMIEALDLTEEQAVRLTVREKDFREKEAVEHKQREEILAELRKQVQAEDDGAAIFTTLDRLEQLGTAMVKRKHAYIRALNDFLSEQQIAKLVLFEHQFASEIKRILGNSRRPRPKKR